MGLAGRHVTKETGITQHSRRVNEENGPVRCGRSGSIRARSEKGQENPRVTPEPRAPEEREAAKTHRPAPHLSAPPSRVEGPGRTPRSCPECGGRRGPPQCRAGAFLKLDHGQRPSPAQGSATRDSTLDRGGLPFSVAFLPGNREPLALGMEWVQCS